MFISLTTRFNLFLIAFAFFAVFCSVPTMATSLSDGVFHIKSNYSVDVAVARATRMLGYHGLRVYGIIDHNEASTPANTRLLPTKLLLFSKPQSISAALKLNRLIALDLPMKLLIWEDNNGVVWVSYNDAQFIAIRHHIVQTSPLVKRMAEMLREIAAAIAK